MRYLTELHLHSVTVSPCSSATAEQILSGYLEQGYHTLVLTEHYSDAVFYDPATPWEEKVEHYLSGWKRLRALAMGRLEVLLGAEMRFCDSSNDYLVYGVDEEFLRTHPNLHQLRFSAFLPLARAHGLFVAQAHPFRNRMSIVDPARLDGMEVFNGHPTHCGRNEIAMAFAKRYSLIPLSGSDYHHFGHPQAGGIYTEEPIVSVSQLIEVLRSRRYTLRCTGPGAERDGVSDIEAEALLPSHSEPISFAQKNSQDK